MKEIEYIHDIFFNITKLLFIKTYTTIIYPNIANKELKCIRVLVYNLLFSHNYINQTKLFIAKASKDVPDNFMMSVSAHGGLVHVVMDEASLTTEGNTSPVMNSAKLITLYLCAIRLDRNINTDYTKKTLPKRKLFTDGH